MKLIPLLTFVAAAALVAGPVRADGGAPESKRIIASDHAPQVLRVRSGGQGPNSQRLHLPLNKAAIVELPEDARDVLVSNPKIVDAVVRTPRRIFLVGLQVGQSNAFFFSTSGKQLLNVEIIVERDMGILEGMIRKAIPGSEIKVDQVNDNVVLTGRVRSVADADAAAQIASRYVTEPGKTPRPESVVSKLSLRGGDQVLVKVKVAEMQRTLSKQFGVDLFATFNIGKNLPLRWDSVNPFSLLGQALSTGQAFRFGNQLDTTRPQTDVEGVIRALERTGVIRTLAEPNLTAVSGESAKFLAGGEFPVPTSRDREGNVQIEFKPFGVGLGFTPVVLSEGRISLRISTEVSELTGENAFVSQGGTFVDSNGQLITVPGITIPGLRVRRAETTVELPSGGSIVMAGLLQQQSKQNIDGLPGLKNVPVLGSLFQSRDYQNGETELVVIVTPYLVDAVSQQQLAAPTDNFAPASDVETVFLSRMNTTYGAREGGKVKGSIKGPVGFIVD
ncbi:MAG TPA: type II and III secretion system protein [Alphaproteobacteria bacterium]|nr:type II and III secretion system protein [Alphaproteobacteria bacterium]HAJ47015.1 type II and III secretion system protein [Alphaproteobacteria bacterium]